MNINELYQECHRLFSYDAETGLLTRKVKTTNRVKVGDFVGCINASGYLVFGIKNKLYYNHRIIWLMQTSCFPEENIDHINGNRADNRPCNLREATQGENVYNSKKHKNTKVGLKGVSMANNRKNPYSADIRCGGQRFRLGHFATPELAYEAYCAKAKELHGEFVNYG
jgi:hypothetical protein